MSSLRLWVKVGGASFGRNKEIWRDTTSCDVCRRHAVCLGYDSSDDEYGAVWICFPCMTRGIVDAELTAAAPPTTSEKDPR